MPLCFLKLYRLHDAFIHACILVWFHKANCPNLHLTTVSITASNGRETHDSFCVIMRFIFIILFINLLNVSFKEWYHPIWRGTFSLENNYRFCNKLTYVPYCIYISNITANFTKAAGKLWRRVYDEITGLLQENERTVMKLQHNNVIWRNMRHKKLQSVYHFLKKIISTDCKTVQLYFTCGHMQTQNLPTHALIRQTFCTLLDWTTSLEP